MCCNYFFQFLIFSFFCRYTERHYIYENQEQKEEEIQINLYIFMKIGVERETVEEEDIEMMKKIESLTDEEGRH